MKEPRLDKQTVDQAASIYLADDQEAMGRLWRRIAETHDMIARSQVVATWSFEAIVTLNRPPEPPSSARSSPRR